MTPRRLKAFTLIELLVVIAIIAILAAMLFPVFARARESARKIQCLSNVKNVAMAVQIYLTDYDKFPPHEHRADVAAWVLAEWGGGSNTVDAWDQHLMDNANPYLRWPAILDEYTKNRDIWRCPSAKNVAAVEHVTPGWEPDWFSYTVAQDYNICITSPRYPVGWGGTVTEGTCSDVTGVDKGAVELDIVPSEDLSREKKMSEINDTAKYIVVAERGVNPEWWYMEQIAYPELCRIQWPCAKSSYESGCDTCTIHCATGGIGCGIAGSDIDKFWTDASMRNPYTRHMGGNNLGFADGHAAWWPADAMISAANKQPPDLEGIPPQCICTSKGE
jgi:prepilin-type N-terminal cleavage/methylation domain-containing protein/prepilin-type processing-associated H-X9-DG protein